MNRKKKKCGCISWLSLTIPDIQLARDFYQHVVGWTTKSSKDQDEKHSSTRFEMQMDNETVAAEIVASTTSASEKKGGIPSVWILHLPVGDLVESLKRVNQYGGTVVQEYTADGTHHAVIRDAIGVHLAIQSY